MVKRNLEICGRFVKSSWLNICHCKHHLMHDAQSGCNECFEHVNVSVLWHYECKRATLSETWQPLLTPWKLGSEFHHLSPGLRARYLIHSNICVQKIHERLPRKSLLSLFCSPGSASEFTKTGWWILPPAKYGVLMATHQDANLTSSPQESNV